ncbi:hypothetical protein C0585_03230 [Candidatus Woesearchaeota archaeon]|nr:MAG: hypothetical protein C0585_03230 [Candidatus Woesearchaeota archaeon]
MSWLFFGLGNAIFKTLEDLTLKKASFEEDPIFLLFVLHTINVVLLIIPLFLFGIPSFNSKFIFAVFINSIIYLATGIMYVKAIKISEISLIAPILSFVPLFLLITSPLILGEFPNPISLIGVILIVAGTYIINMNSKKDFMDPLTSIFRHKGTRLVLFVTILWSFAANFDKMAIVNSNPFFYLVIVNLLQTIYLLPIIILSKKKISNKTNIKWILLAGLFGTLMILSAMYAIQLTLVAYVVSVKRLSIILTVIVGSLLFKEHDLKKRSLGSVIMVIGAILIGLNS